MERDVHFDSLACLHYHPSVKMALILTKKKKTVVCQVPEVLGVLHMYTFLKVFSRIKKKKKKEEFSLGCFLLENSSLVGHYRQF